MATVCAAESLIVVLGYRYFLACRNYLQKTGTPPVQKRKKKQKKKTKKQIHVKAYSLKDAFSDNTGHDRWTVNHRIMALQARKHVPSIDLEYKNAEFCYSTMPDVIIIVSLLIAFNYFIENTNTHIKHTSFTLIRTLNSAVT